MSTEDYNFAQARIFWGGIDYDIKTAPPQRTWVDLTDEEIGELIIGTLSADTNPAQTRPRDIKFARSVLAKFKDKNA